MSGPGSLWLASGSPRRRALLAEAGIVAEVRAPDIDDGMLRPGRVRPMHWVAALAYLKARRVADALHAAGDRGLVLGADTVCVVDGRILGQPADAETATSMLRSMRDRDHETWTGVCLLRLERRSRLLFADRAVVRLGAIDDDEVDRYVRSRGWVGKAGGYNLAERLEAGWPLECRGDPTSVMGLPMERLQRWLDRAGRPSP